jgi:hypothetical protein
MRRQVIRISLARAGAITIEISTPSFASARSRPRNAKFEISSETVKPMPITAPPPARTGQLIGNRGPRNAGRDTSSEPSRIPTGLPTR